jgi:hypothetical protein
MPLAVCVCISGLATDDRRRVRKTGPGADRRLALVGRACTAGPSNRRLIGAGGHGCTAAQRQAQSRRRVSASSDAHPPPSSTAAACYLPACPYPRFSLCPPLLSARLHVCTRTTGSPPVLTFARSAEARGEPATHRAVDSARRHACLRSPTLVSSHARATGARGVGVRGLLAPEQYRSQHTSLATPRRDRAVRPLQCPSAPARSDTYIWRANTAQRAQRSLGIGASLRLPHRG